MNSAISLEECEARGVGSQPRARGFERDSREAVERQHDVASYAERTRHLHRDFLDLLDWAGR